MDAEKLRQYLRAVEDTHDKVMQENNLHPQSLRTEFYRTFTTTYEPVPKTHIIHSEIPYIYYIVIKINEYEEWNESEQETGEEIHEFFVITKQNNEFITFVLEQHIPMTRINSWPDGATFKQIDVVCDFVSITLHYHLFILDICERWGFLSVTHALKKKLTHSK